VKGLIDPKTFWSWSSIGLAVIGIGVSLAYSVFDLTFVVGFFGLIVLPGYLVSWLVPESELGLPDRLIVSVVLGISLICAVGLGFTLLGVSIDSRSILISYLAIDVVCLGVIGRRLCRSGFGVLVRGLRQVDSTHFLLLIIWMGAVFVRLFPVRAMVVPPYHDPAVHAIFAELIIEKGAIPTSLEPYANVSMTYPPGLHLILAFFSLATGLPVGKLLLLLTNLFNGTIVLSAYLLFAKISKNQVVGLFSALLIGFVSHLPASLFFAGKNSMIAGFLLLPVTILLTYRSLSRKAQNSREYFNYLAAAMLSFFGLILVYYSAAFLYLMFVIPYVVCETIYNYSRGELRVGNQYLIGFLFIFILGIALSAPYTIRQYIVETDPSYASFKQLFYTSRTPVWITSSLITTQSNLELLVVRQFGDLITLFSILGVLTVLVTTNWRKNCWSMVVWFVVILFFTTPYPSMWVHVFYELTGDIMQMVFFLPLCFFSAVFISELIRRLGTIQRAVLQRDEEMRRLKRVVTRWISYLVASIRVLFVIMLVLLACFAGYASYNSYAAATGGALVHTATDYEALVWIRDNTPKNATFLNNVYVWWDKEIILGSDAGSWIPAIAHRRVLFPVENIGDAWPQPALKKYSVLVAAAINPDNTTNLTLMKEYGITYAYIGPATFPPQKPLDPRLFLASQYFTLVWHKDGVWIFELIQQKPPP
jgi:hypothetical protein